MKLNRAIVLQIKDLLWKLIDKKSLLMLYKEIKCLQICNLFTANIKIKTYFLKIVNKKEISL